MSPSQGWQYDTVRMYGTVRLNFCDEVRYAGTVRLFCNGTGTACLFCDVTDTVRWYAV